jgi:hypothetical protein
MTRAAGVGYACPQQRLTRICRTRAAPIAAGCREIREIPANADVAQLVEHFTRNEGVGSSSLPVGFRTQNSSNRHPVREPKSQQQAERVFESGHERGYPFRRNRAVDHAMVDREGGRHNRRNSELTVITYYRLRLRR